MDNFKAVQIGCGGRAQTHARAIAQVERLDFVATCDLIEEKAKKTASTHDVPRTYTDFREMIETEEPDVVAFIAPPAIRSQIVLPVLEYKPKALVIEKPMAISLEEAEEMVAAADKAGTCFVISHQCRYSEEMVKLRKLIKNGRLGKVEKIIVNCKLNLMGQGTHILDLIQMMLQEKEPRWVMAQIDGTSQLYARGGGAHPTCDHAILQIGYDDGVTAFASIGARHSHLDNAGYSVDQKVLIKEKLSPEELTENLLTEERWRQILSSLVVCFFARGIYKPDVVLEALNLIGLDFDEERLNQIGEKIHREKYRFKVREGFSMDDVRLPKRIFKTPSSIGNLDEAYIRQAIDHFKKLIIDEVAKEI